MSVLARYGDQYWTSHYGVATPTYHAPGAQQAADQLQVGVTCHEASRHTLSQEGEEEGGEGAVPDHYRASTLRGYPGHNPGQPRTDAFVWRPY